MKIAILDDSQVYAHILKEILIFKDHNVRIFGKATDLLKDKFLNQYDIIIIDLCLPDQYGLSVIREIKEMNVSAVLIVASVDFSGMVYSKLREIGVRHILKKPFVFEDLEKIMVSIQKVESLIDDFVNGGTGKKKMLILTDGGNYKILHHLKHVSADEFIRNADDFNSDETCIIDKTNFSQFLDNFPEINRIEEAGRAPKLIILIEDDLKKIGKILSEKEAAQKLILKSAFFIDLKYTMS
ncbi:MAG: response regulator [bacterium]